MLKANLKEAFSAEELAADLSRVERRVGRRRVARRAAWVAAPLALALGIGGAWTLDDGDPVSALVAANGEPIARDLGAGVHRFSDDSSVTIGEGGALRAHAESDRADFTLERGRARFDIVPGGPRRWSVTAGDVRVEVLGTSFTVERSAERVSVRVHRGVVEVRASGESRRLLAEESFATGPEPIAATAPTETSAPASQGTVEATLAEATLAEATLAEAASSDSTSAHVSPHPPANRASAELSVAERLARSDRARQRGDIEEAVSELNTIVRSHPDAPEAASAAASLGRLEQRRGHLAAAAAAYERALALTPPPTLGELVHERLVALALERGDRAGAERWSQAHRHAFPQGRRRAAIDALLDAP